MTTMLFRKDSATRRRYHGCVGVGNAHVGVVDRVIGRCRRRCRRKSPLVQLDLLQLEQIALHLALVLQGVLRRQQIWRQWPRHGLGRRVVVVVSQSRRLFLFWRGSFHHPFVLLFQCLLFQCSLFQCLLRCQLCCCC